MANQWKQGRNLWKALQLYAVTDRSFLGNRPFAEQVEQALQGGATCLQLREKHLGQEAFLKEAWEIKELCDRYQVPLIINDNVEVVLRTGADGVHLGPKDMSVREARKLLGKDKIKNEIFYFKC